jgi:hypothetical protein
MQWLRNLSCDRPIVSNEASSPESSSWCFLLPVSYFSFRPSCSCLCFFLVFPSLSSLHVSFLQKQVLEGSSDAKCDQSSYPCFVVLYVGSHNYYSNKMHTFIIKSVHFVGVIIVWLSTCTEGQQLKLYVGCSILPWLYVTLHFSHDRSSYVFHPTPLPYFMFKWPCIVTRFV